MKTFLKSLPFTFWRPLAALAALTLAACATNPMTAAPDDEGHRIVAVIQKEFPIPDDAFSGHEGISSIAWSYYDTTGEKVGTQITMYGISDKGLQDQIVRRINNLRTTAVHVRFYDDSRFAVPTGENPTPTLGRPPVATLLRDQILK